MTLKNGQVINYLDKATAEYVYQEIFEDEVYLKHFINIQEGDVIFDIGANIGLFSLYVAQKISDFHIYAFEPVPPIYDVLKKNLQNIHDIKLFNIGLGEKTGDIDIYYYPKVSADSTPVPFDMELKVQQYKENWQRRVVENIPIARIVPSFLRKSAIRFFLKRMYKPEVLSCRIKTLSEIINQENIEQIDLLKIDAENYEKHVLAGIKQDDWDKIRQISMEVHEHIEGGKNLLKEMTELLEKHHFKTEIGTEEEGMGVYMLYAMKT